MTEAAPRSRLARYAVVATTARLADGSTATALVLLALDRTGSPAVGGALVAASTLPHLVAAPAVGALADRIRSVRTFYVAAFLAFAGSLLGVVVSLGRAPLAVPFGCALAAGAAGPLLTGGMSSLLGGLVPAHALPRAFAVDTGTYNAAGIVGPALVALVAEALSPAVAAGAVAGCAVAAALFMTLLPAAEQARRPDVGARALVAGVEAVFRSPPLRASTLATTLGMMGTAGVLPLAAALFTVHLGHPANAGGTLLSAFAAGALIGSLVVSARPIDPRHAMRAIHLGIAATGLLLALAALSPSYVLVLVLFAAAGVADAPMLTASFMIRTAQAPAGARTQVFTTVAGLKIGGSALRRGRGDRGLARRTGPSPAGLRLPRRRARGGPAERAFA